MSSKLSLAAVVVAAVGVAGCGSSGGGAAPSRGKSSSGRPVRTYHVKLNGAAVGANGARAGTGAAVIALHHHAVVCYRFAHLRGFAAPTSAQLGLGAPGKRGKVVLELSRGTLLHHKGCARATRALGAALEKSPTMYYVQIVTKQYPQGAVRGQL